MLTISCNGQKTDDVVVIIQPKMEKGKSNSIKILFKNLNREDSISVQSIENFELNDNPLIQETERNGDKYLEYFNLIIPRKTGKFTLPKIKGFRKDKILTAKSMDIEVVDKMPDATDKDIILKLVSDKKIYNKKDTINFSLYEYNKYVMHSHCTVKFDSLLYLPKTKRRDEAIRKIQNDWIYKLSGNESLEKQLENDFEVVEVKTDFYRNESIMEKLNGSLYIKTLLVSFDVLPKHKGEYTIKPSEHIFFIDKSTNYQGSHLNKRDDGSFDVSRHKDRIHIKSNKLSFTVK